MFDTADHCCLSEYCISLVSRTLHSSGFPLTFIHCSVSVFTCSSSPQRFNWLAPQDNLVFVLFSSQSVLTFLMILSSFIALYLHISWNFPNLCFLPLELQAHISPCLCSISTAFSNLACPKPKSWSSLSTYSSYSVSHLSKWHFHPFICSYQKTWRHSWLFLIPHIQSVSKSCWLYLPDITSIQPPLHCCYPNPRRHHLSHGSLLWSPSWHTCDHLCPSYCF